MSAIFQNGPPALARLEDPAIFMLGMRDTLEAECRKAGLGYDPTANWDDLEQAHSRWRNHAAADIWKLSPDNRGFYFRAIGWLGHQISASNWTVETHDISTAAVVAQSNESRLLKHSPTLYVTFLFCAKVAAAAHAEAMRTGPTPVASFIAKQDWDVIRSAVDTLPNEPWEWVNFLQIFCGLPPHQRVGFLGP